MAAEPCVWGHQLLYKEAIGRVSNRRDRILLSAAAGSTGLGMLGARWPLGALGVGSMAVLAALPWGALFAALEIAAVVQRHRTTIGGLTFRPEELILIPFALRAVQVNRTAAAAWRAAEWLLLGHILIQPVSSLLYAENVPGSLLSASLLAFGAVAYYAVSRAVCTGGRLVLATRIFVAGTFLTAVSGIAAVASRVLFGTEWGISLSTIDPVRPPHGIAYEANIYGSISAAGALVFLGLFRERNQVLPRTVSLLGFLICLTATLLSLSRGAWVGFLVALALFVVLPRGAGRRRGGVLGSIFMLAVLGAIAVAVILVARAPLDERNPLTGVGQQSGTLLDFEEGSGAKRAEEWRIALDEVEDSLVLGLGTNSYPQRHQKSVNPPKGAFLGNLYIRTLHDSGILGFGLLIGFLVAVLWPRRRLLSATGEFASVARALTFGWFVLAVSYMATGSMFLMWPWIFLGLVRAARTVSEREEVIIDAARGISRRRPGMEHRAPPLTLGGHRS